MKVAQIHLSTHLGGQKPLKFTLFCVQIVSKSSWATELLKIAEIHSCFLLKSFQQSQDLQNCFVLLWNRFKVLPIIQKRRKSGCCDLQMLLHPKNLQIYLVLVLNPFRCISIVLKHWNSIFCDLLGPLKLGHPISLMAFSSVFVPHTFKQAISPLLTPPHPNPSTILLLQSICSIPPSLLAVFFQNFNSK